MLAQLGKLPSYNSGDQGFLNSFFAPAFRANGTAMHLAASQGHADCCEAMLHAQGAAANINTAATDDPTTAAAVDRDQSRQEEEREQKSGSSSRGISTASSGSAASSG